MLFIARFGQILLADHSNLRIAPGNLLGNRLAHTPHLFAQCRKIETHASSFAHLFVSFSIDDSPLPVNDTRPITQKRR